jgi:TatD DNase family protein
MRLFDAHVHLDFYANAPQVASQAQELGLSLFACTVTPGGYLRASRELARERGVYLAAGAHPWWVSDGRIGEKDVDTLVSMLPGLRFVGEVGMDFSPAHVGEGTRDAQVLAFERIMRACAETSDPTHQKVVSIHSVRSADAVLDILEQTGAAKSCRCVFHWFSGRPEELWRAARMGCHFSFGELSLATRRGREYVREVPRELLLTETDLPAGEKVFGSAQEISLSLGRAIEKASEIRDEDVGALAASNAKALLA